MNRTTLLGRLGHNPESNYSKSGVAISNFRMATDEYFTSKDGTKNRRTEWHRIVTFGKLAESCRDYLAKGRQVLVEGRLQTRQWEDKDGNKRYTTEIVANNVTFLGSNPDKGSKPAGEEHTDAPPPEDDTPAESK